MFRNPAHFQNGGGLVAAIALITIVALISVAITRTVQLGAGSVSLDIISQRAALAASSGANLTLNRVFAPAGSSACSNATWDLSNVPGLPFCQAVVSCNATLIRGRSYYLVESAATCSADTLQAQRSVRVRASG